MWLLLALSADAGEPRAPTGMAGHFQEAALAMLAVAVDDRKGAKDHIKELATSDVAPGPLRDAARDALTRIKKVDSSGPAVAELVTACAKCHLAGGRGPEPRDTDVIPGATAVDRHIMASMFIWIGLVTPIEQPFLLGLDELLPHVDLESDEGVQEVADTWVTLARNARAAKSWAERRDTFGNMLVVCVECHERAGVTGR